MSPTEKIQQLPEYMALTRARKKIVWPLSIAMIVAYFALILAIAFTPAALSTPVNQGVTSIGILLGLGIIFVCFILTGIYVHYANTVIEPLAKRVVDIAGELK